MYKQGQHLEWNGRFYVFFDIYGFLDCRIWFHFLSKMVRILF